MLTFLAILGGLFFRARGGWPSIPRPFEQMVFCLPVLAIAYCGLDGFYLQYFLTFVVYALSVIAVLKGHGNNMDLGTWTKPADDEWYEFTIKFLKPKLSAYWYDAVGLAVSGLTYTLPLIFISPLLALSGALKAPAYIMGWAMHPNGADGKIKFTAGKFTLKTATEWGEFFTGFFIWAALSTYFW